MDQSVALTLIPSQYHAFTCLLSRRGQQAFYLLRLRCSKVLSCSEQLITYAVRHVQCSRMFVVYSLFAMWIEQPSFKHSRFAGGSWTPNWLKLRSSACCFRLWASEPDKSVSFSQLH